MAYSPPTPQLPDDAALDVILAAFDVLPVGPWSWEGYLNRNGARHDSVSLIASQAGQPTIFTYSKTSGYLFRAANEMQDLRDLLPTQNFEKPIGTLHNPAAIALKSAWLVPLLIRQHRALTAPAAGQATDRVGEAVEGRVGKHLQGQLARLYAQLHELQKKVAGGQTLDPYADFEPLSSTRNSLVFLAQQVEKQDFEPLDCTIGINENGGAWPRRKVVTGTHQR